MIGWCSRVFFAFFLFFLFLPHFTEARVGLRPAASLEKNRSSYTFRATSSVRTFSDSVVVVNNGKKEQFVSLDIVDTIRSSGGDKACRQSTESKNIVGKWAHISSAPFLLAPGEERKVSFTLRVPHSFQGSTEGCVVVQELQKDPSSQGAGMRVLFRAAVKIYVQDGREKGGVSTSGDRKRKYKETKQEKQNEARQFPVIASTLQKNVVAVAEPFLMEEERKVGFTVTFVAL